MVCCPKDLELYVHLVHCSDAAENENPPFPPYTHINQENVLYAQPRTQNVIRDIIRNFLKETARDWDAVSQPRITISPIFSDYCSQTLGQCCKIRRIPPNRYHYKFTVIKTPLLFWLQNRLFNSTLPLELGDSFYWCGIKKKRDFSHIFKEIKMKTPRLIGILDSESSV